MHNLAQEGSRRSVVRVGTSVRWVASRGHRKWRPLTKVCTVTTIILLPCWWPAQDSRHGCGFVEAKGLVGKLPGNPASCQEEPCNSDPQHVLYALKWMSLVFGLILLLPIVMYYMSKLFSKLREMCTPSDEKEEEKKSYSGTLQREALAAYEAAEQEENVGKKKGKKYQNKKFSSATCERTSSVHSSSHSNSISTSAIESERQELARKQRQSIQNQPIDSAAAARNSIMSKTSEQARNSVASQQQQQPPPTSHNHQHHRRRSKQRPDGDSDADGNNNAEAVSAAALTEARPPEECAPPVFESGECESAAPRATSFAATADAQRLPSAAAEQQQLQQSSTWRRHTKHRVFPESPQQQQQPRETPLALVSNLYEQATLGQQQQQQPLGNNNCLAVPSLGPQHRHSIDGSILDNMMHLQQLAAAAAAAAASGRDRHDGEDEEQGRFNGAPPEHKQRRRKQSNVYTTNETVISGGGAASGKQRRASQQAARAKTKRAHLEEAASWQQQFQAHQRQLAELQQFGKCPASLEAAAAAQQWHQQQQQQHSRPPADMVARLAPGGAQQHRRPSLNAAATMRLTAAGRK